MREERIEPSGIPARVYDPGHDRGVILLGHGGGHSKDSERFVQLCRHFATTTGLAVVCMDAIDHGERKPPAATPGLPRGWHSASTPQMVLDWSRTAEALEPLGRAVAYVGFSMGALFGVATVASMPAIEAAVFVVGGVPSGAWIDDPDLRPLLLDVASKLDDVDILMVNKTEDELFSRADVHELFDAIPGSRKQLTFWDGPHDEWPQEAIDEAAAFITSYAT